MTEEQENQIRYEELKYIQNLYAAAKEPQHFEAMLRQHEHQLSRKIGTIKR